MSDFEQQPDPLPQFPNYPKPTAQGIPNHGAKFAGPLNSLAMSKLKTPARSPSRGHKTKGIHTSSKIHITHRKTKWY